MPVGVATSNGRSYYAITSLLKRSHIPYVDVIPNVLNLKILERESVPLNGQFSKKLKLIITTRKERLEVIGSQVVCIEDLGEDFGLGKQRLLALLYPLKATDRFVVGIDPGERTGIAAFMNHIEIDSDVSGSIEDTIMRAKRLLDNAPKIQKIVKIGCGMPRLAEKIASSLDDLCRSNGDVRIQLVDERGTSSLYASGKSRGKTRDQHSAKLIAFRDGRDYFPIVSLIRAHGRATPP
jgi:hypothetical protein